MNILEKTMEIMEGIMNSICGWLTLIMENKSMFRKGGCFRRWTFTSESQNNKILFSFFEKEMVSPLVLHRSHFEPRIGLQDGQQQDGKLIFLKAGKLIK